MELSRFSRWTLRVVTWLGLAFLYLPLLVVAVLSFNTATSLSWPPRGLTLDWWRAAWEADGPREALWSSVKVALAATAIALVLGTLAAFAMQRFRFFGQQRPVVPVGSCRSRCPASSPPSPCRTASTGRSPSARCRSASASGSTRLVIAHATFCVVIAYNNVIARLRRSSPEPASRRRPTSGPTRPRRSAT